jgi:hypothetical protein
MMLRTSRGANRYRWGVCERALKLHPLREGLSGKAKTKTGIGKSDLPGLQGGPRKRDFVSMTQRARLGPRWTAENRQFVDRSKPAISAGDRDK